MDNAIECVKLSDALLEVYTNSKEQFFKDALEYDSIFLNRVFSVAMRSDNTKHPTQTKYFEMALTYFMKTEG